MSISCLTLFRCHSQIEKPAERKCHCTAEQNKIAHTNYFIVLHINIRITLDFTVLNYVAFQTRYQSFSDTLYSTGCLKKVRSSKLTILYEW